MVRNHEIVGSNPTVLTVSELFRARRRTSSQIAQTFRCGQTVRQPPVKRMSAGSIPATGAVAGSGVGFQRLAVNEFVAGSIPVSHLNAGQSFTTCHEAGGPLHSHRTDPQAGKLRLAAKRLNSLLRITLRTMHGATNGRASQLAMVAVSKTVERQQCRA